MSQLLNIFINVISKYKVSLTNWMGIWCYSLSNYGHKIHNFHSFFVCRVHQTVQEEDQITQRLKAFPRHSTAPHICRRKLTVTEDTQHGNLLHQLSSCFQVAYLSLQHTKPATWPAQWGCKATFCVIVWRKQSVVLASLYEHICALL